MNIKWLGHSSFRLEESTGTAIVIDPYNDCVGYKMPKVSANAVTISHSHDDHTAVAKVGGKPIVIDTIGAFEVAGIHITSLASFHDDKQGTLRGENRVFKFRIDGVDICHLGDIGEVDNTLCEGIGSVNVLLIPVGGYYTIDAAQAREYVDLLMPDVVIPMHYRTKDCAYSELEKLDEFLELFDDEDIEYIDSNSFELDRALDTDFTKVIVLRK